MFQRRTRVILLFTLLLAPVAASAMYSLSRTDGLQRFHSYDELRDFIESDTYNPQGTDIGLFFRGPSTNPQSAGQRYSTTNIQVAGVDEADILKNDGEFIYSVSGNNVSVIKAYPASEARILSTLSFPGRPEGLYVQGARLVVLWQNFTTFYCRICPLTEISRSSMPYFGGASSTVAQVYDVSEKSNPVLKQTVSTEGFLLGSRLIGDYVYLIVSHYVWSYNEEVLLPQLTIDGRVSEIPAEDIYYSPQRDFSYAYTLIIALNVQQDSANPSTQTYLLGASGTIYVSLENLYLTMPSYDYTENSYSVRTVIHRIHLSGQNIAYMATGTVPGTLLDQFSMDEYNGFLRIATTIPPQFFILRTASGSPTFAPTTAERVADSTNNIYILNLDLQTVSSIEGLASGEQIHSARFLGDRAYLVTFKKIDPLFVLDLADPYNPRVLGELKITGYSDYLHPYDETHIIGIGKETADSGSPDFAWYQGVKISLFDVSDVSNPREVAKVEIGDRGTDSEILRDHKALLFDRERNLLVIPIHLARINSGNYPEGVPPWAWGDFVWQGVYVFHVSPVDGITLKGTVTHETGSTRQDWWYWQAPYFITRSLYIESVLYTISDSMIQMHDIDTLTFIGKIALPTGSRSETIPIGSANSRA